MGTFSTTTNSCLKPYYGSNTADWYSAHSQCASFAPLGTWGRLAQIPTQTVSDIVKAFSNNGKAWVALMTVVRDSSSMSDWRWYSDPVTAVDCVRFSPAATDMTAIARTDCGYMQGTFNGFYGDVCSNKNGIVCEFFTSKHSS